MADDDEFNFGGRKRKSSGSQGTPRPNTSTGGGSSNYTIKLGTMPGGNIGFAARVRKQVAIAKRSSGRRSYSQPSKPRSGRYNKRGRGIRR